MIRQKMNAVFVALAAFAAVVVGSVPAWSSDEKATETSAARCVDAGRLTTRMVLDKDTLFIEDASGRGAVLEMGAPCANMDELDQIGFEITGSSQLCRRTDVKVIHYNQGGGIPARCLIKSVKHLTREETLAYRKGQG